MQEDNNTRNSFDTNIQQKETDEREKEKVDAKPSLFPPINKNQVGPILQDQETNKISVNINESNGPADEILEQDTARNEGK